MNERRFTDEDLEAALRDVGARLAYPPAADLVPAVRSRIEGHRQPGFWGMVWSPRLAVVPALATAALLLVATLALQPAGADALEAIGLRGLVVFRGAEPAPRTNAKAILPDAKRMATVEGASTETGFRIVVPRELGDPDEVYTRIAGTDQAGHSVTQAFLVYGARDGVTPSSQTGIAVLVTEVRGGVAAQLLGKVLPSGGTVEQVTVNGGRGVWIAGTPHQLFYTGPAGDILVDSVRLSGNVLVWEQGELLLRIEADIPKDRALRIASSMR